jgi:hypothetical protein
VDGAAQRLRDRLQSGLIGQLRQCIVHDAEVPKRYATNRRWRRVIARR